MRFLSHLSVKSIVGFLVAAFVLFCQLFGVDVHDLAPSLSLAIANLAQAAAALVPLAFALWGHIQLVKKHVALVTSIEAPAATDAPASALPADHAARQVLPILAALLFLGGVLALSLTACSAPAPAVGSTPSGGEEGPAAGSSAASTVTPSAASAAIEAALPIIRTGAAVATGAVLDFTVQQASTRTRLANEMYTAAHAIYTLSGGAFPTPTELSSTVLTFGGSEADAGYTQFSTAISSLYSSWYPKLTASNDTKTAADLLNAVAGGIEDATQSYVTTPAPASN